MRQEMPSAGQDLEAGNDFRAGISATSTNEERNDLQRACILGGPNQEQVALRLAYESCWLHALVRSCSVSGGGYEWLVHFCRANEEDPCLQKEWLTAGLPTQWHTPCLAIL